MDTTGIGYRLRGTLGGKGSAPGRFRSSLRGLFVDADGRVFAVGDRSVKVWTPSGELARHWKTSKPGVSITVDTDGRVIVGESGQLEIFDEKGRPLATWRDAGRFGLVTALGSHGKHVYAADARARVIRRLSRDGRLERSIGEPGPRGFKLPGGFLDFGIDADGVIHAANPGKHRVERYSPDGDLLGRFGRFGMSDPKDFTGCCNPINVAVGSVKAVSAALRAGEAAAGLHIAVTEKAPPRAKVYDANGELLAWVGGDIFHRDCRTLDIAIGPTGRLWVADSVRLAIRIFDPITEGPEGSTTR